MEPQKIFVSLPDKAEWEDHRIFLSESEAIKESKKYTKRRVEIFEQKNPSEGPFEPTYMYYQGGKLCPSGTFIEYTG